MRPSRGNSIIYQLFVENFYAVHDHSGKHNALACYGAFTHTLR